MAFSTPLLRLVQDVVVKEDTRRVSNPATGLLIFSLVITSLSVVMRFALLPLMNGVRVLQRRKSSFRERLEMLGRYFALYLVVSRAESRAA